MIKQLRKTVKISIRKCVLEFVPDWFVTHQQVKICHDDDDYDDDRYQKRKSQKAKIKEELMPIAWHPNR